MKRFILPLILVAVMVSVVGVLGFVLVKYAVDVANLPKPFTYPELENLQEKPRVDDKDVPRLFACFERNDPDLQIKAAEVLAQNSGQALPTLREKLKSKSAKVRYYTLQTFAFMDPAEAGAAAEEIVVCLDDQDAEVRQKAVYVVGRIGAKNDAAVTGLIKALDDKDSGIVDAALEALKKTGAPRKAALPALTMLARDSDFTKSNAALDLLGKMGPDAVPAFKDLLKDENFPNAHRLTQALLGLGENANPLLPSLEAKLLANGSNLGQPQLLQVFAKCGDDGAKGLARLLDGYKGGGPGSHEVVRIIGTMGASGKFAVPTLIVYVKTGNPIRRDILETLGEIGPSAKEAIPVVRELTNDPDVGAEARVALKRMGVFEK